MGHGRGRAGERLGASEAHREVRDLERVKEGERLLFSAFEIEREGRSGARAMALENVGLARSLVEKTQIADLLDFGVALQEVAHLFRILPGAAHPQLERFEAAQK